MSALASQRNSGAAVISPRSVYRPLLPKKERQKRFRLSKGVHWTTEHEGKTVRRVKVAGAIEMPSLFCFETNYNETAGMLLGIRDRMNEILKDHYLSKKLISRQSRRNRRYFDFASIDYISPAAALVFAAEYDRARCFLDRWTLKLYNKAAWKESVASSLSQLGFLELLGIQGDDIGTPIDHLHIMRFQQSSRIDQGRTHGFLSELARLVGVAGDINKEMGRLRLYEALVEATENVMTHAYDVNPPRDELVVKRWWMTGAVDRREGRMTIVVYDQGATIPARLPSSLLWREKLYRFQKRLFGTDEAVRSSENDGMLLRLAMSVPSSSTKNPNRGKGLGVLRAVVEHCKAGRLLVISRNGEYVYKSGSRPSYRQLKVPLYGTLIQWDLWRPEWKLSHAI